MRCVYFLRYGPMLEHARALPTRLQSCAWVAKRVSFRQRIFT
jgi:hypothetical protein